MFIKFNLYQGDTVVSDTIDSATNLLPGQNVKVQAFVNTIKGKPDSFNVTEITAY
ncbi:FxLYD domain-containing protein [Brenneria uluponensis]|uniref:FxLYD domain-containing protein n=1 Tax=Brenneria uluponensis TaxID=3057057 RepID=UPI0028EA2348|nr:FxLYD domain-containing protein [Brenneria ulupoensis]